MAGLQALFGLVFSLMFAVMILAVVFWILKLVEVVQIPEHQYRAAGTDKLLWVLVVVLGSQVGALVWHFGKRPSVRAAAGRIPLPPPGWYPDPGTRTMQFWDGQRWLGPANNPPAT